MNKIVSVCVCVCVCVWVPVLCICFPNEDVVLRHSVVNTLPRLITPRLFSVLGCQRIFFLNYSVFFLAASRFEYNPSSSWGKNIFPVIETRLLREGRRPAYCIRADSLHTNARRPLKRWYLIVAGVLTEAFPCPAPACPCPPTIIDIDRCGADSANLHPNRISTCLSHRGRIQFTTLLCR